MAEAATSNTTTSEDSKPTKEDDGSSSTRSSRPRRSSCSDDLSDDIETEDESENKKNSVDYDEDKRCPQYIPRKGTFYQHDNRNQMDGKVNKNNRRDPVEASADAAGALKTRGKVWKKEVDRWTHDLYNEDEQKPKTTKELIDTYGYDIRNPSTASCNHRFRRGPNKYIRNWENEEGSTRAASQRRFNNNKEYFPDSHGRNRDKNQSEMWRVAERVREWNESPCSTIPAAKDKLYTSTKQRNLPPQGIRGPNKYIPNWENEEGSTRAASQRRFNNNKEYFPDSHGRNRDKTQSEMRKVAERVRESRGSTIPAAKDKLYTSTKSRNLPPQGIRGPNKYIPNWENEEGSTRAASQRRFNNNKEYFPDSHGRNRDKNQSEMKKVAERVRESPGSTIPAAKDKLYTSTKLRNLPPQGIAVAKDVVDIFNRADENLKHAAKIVQRLSQQIKIITKNTIVEEIIIPSSERRLHGQDCDGGENGGGRSKRYSVQRQRMMRLKNESVAPKPPIS